MTKRVLSRLGHNLMDMLPILWTAWWMLALVLHAGMGASSESALTIAAGVVVVVFVLRATVVTNWRIEEAARIDKLRRVMEPPQSSHPEPPVGAIPAAEFMALCSCPSCGSEDWHSIRQPRTSESDFAPALVTAAIKVLVATNDTIPPMREVINEAMVARLTDEQLALAVEAYNELVANLQDQHRADAVQWLAAQERGFDVFRTCSCGAQWGQHVG